MNRILTPVITVLLIAGFIVVQSLYIVDQRSQAILLQFGQPVGAHKKAESDDDSFIKGPGLHFKIPFIQTVRYFDSRILAVDPEPEQVVISSSLVGGRQSEKAKAENEANMSDMDAEIEAMAAPPSIQDVSGEPIIVDTFARYKIIDPLQFLKTMRTIESANSRLETILNDATRAALGQTTLKELLSDERTAVMDDIKKRVNYKISLDQLGIEIVDIRIVRADLTQDLRTSTVRRMISELKERATETRARGEERALEIRSNADRMRTVILAEAERDSQVIKGQGDNEAISVYINAFSKDKDFYSFIRSMEAYKNTLSSSDTQFILSPDSRFFQYLENAGRQ